jgi:uncharacterized protein YukE
MPVMGAHTEQLAQLGRSLQHQIDAIEAITSTVTSALSGTTWNGPARDRFEQEWNGTFRNALAKLSEAFDTAGRSCIARSAALDQALGAH